MPYTRNYPATTREVLDPPVVFKQATVDAVTNFSMANPWEGNVEEKFAKFKALQESLNTIYGKQTKLYKDFTTETRTSGSSGSSYYSPSTDEIHLQGKFSVVTYLHEYGHVLGKDEREAVRWSLNLFRKVFPEKFAALNSRGHMVLSNSNVAKGKFHPTRKVGQNKSVKVKKHSRRMKR